MGTNNFHNMNATRVFACEIEEEWDYDDLVNDVKSELDNNEPPRGFSDQHELRSFPSKVIGYNEKIIPYKHFNLEIKTVAIVRSGYYQGCNLDHTQQVFIDGLEVELSEEHDFIIEALAEVFSYAKIKISSTNLTHRARGVNSKIIKYCKEEIQRIERTFRDFSTPLNKIGQFSNGEALYEKAN